MVCQRLVDERRPARRPDDEHDRMLAGSFTHVFEALFVDAQHHVDRCQEEHGQLRGRACVGPPGSPIGGPSTRHRLGLGSSGSVTDPSSPGFTIRRWTVRWSRAVLHACPHQGSAPQPCAHRGAAAHYAREIVYPTTTTTTTTPSPCSPAASFRWKATRVPCSSCKACPSRSKRRTAMRLDVHVFDPTPGTSSTSASVRARIGARVEGDLLTDCSWRSVTPGPSAWTMRVATVSYTDSS